MEKIAYIIPGYEESHLKQKGYNKIANFFKAKGIKPIHIKIKWDLKKPIDFEKYNQQFLKQFHKNKNQEVYVLGFSYGAVISFLTASQTKPKALILCSLSPYFIEDYKNLKPSWLKWWKKNFKNEYVFKDYSGKISTKTYLIVGSKEDSCVHIRVRQAKKQIKNSLLVVAKGAKHNISQKEYLFHTEKLVNKVSGNL